MDPAVVWGEIERFQEQGLATTASLHGGAQEKALVLQFLQRVPMEALFGVLQWASDASDAKKVKITCAAIDRVLGSDANEGMFFQPEMTPFIVAGLRHHEKAARVLSVNQLISHLKNQPTSEQSRAMANPMLLEELCSAMADEEVEVASKAASVLDMLSSVEGEDYYKAIIDALHSTAQNDDISESSVEFARYLDAISRISAKSEQHTQHAIASGAIDIILKCLKSNDALFVMNVLDLIPNLCQTTAGIVNILDSGTLQTLLNMSQDPLIGDSALRLLGEISAAAAKRNVQSWNWSDPMLSKAFLSTIESKMQSSDAQQIAAMDAIAAFASSSERELNLLLQHKHLCKLLLVNGMSTKMPLKVNCFHTVARILGEPTRLNKQPDHVIAENATQWALHERLFQALGPECRHQTTMALLMDCLRQPFDEIRIAVFTLLRAVAAQNSEWGVRVLLSYGGFFEFLLDRTTEPSKETREWKFAVVDAVLASPFQQQLDATLLAKLQEHLRKGPYVGKGATEMELEAA